MHILKSIGISLFPIDNGPRLTRGMVRITRNTFSKLYPSFIPIYRYMVSGVRIQLPGASILTPETFCKSE